MISIRKARQLQNPLKNYAWEFFIPNPPIYFSRESLAASLLSVPLAASVFTFPLRIRQAMIPGFSIDTFKSYWGAFSFGHAGKKSYGENETFLRFEEGNDSMAFPIGLVFNLWANMIFNETTDEGVPEEHLMCDMFLRLLKPDETTLFAYHFYYAFPSRVVDTVIDYSSPEIVNIDVMMRFDYAKAEIWPL